MCKYFTAGIIKILVLTLLLSSAFVPCKAGIFRTQDTIKVPTKDTGNFQGSDTVKPEGSDTVNTMALQDSVAPTLPDSVFYKKTDFTAFN